MKHYMNFVTAAVLTFGLAITKVTTVQAQTKVSAKEHAAHQKSGNMAAIMKAGANKATVQKRATSRPKTTAKKSMGAMKMGKKPTAKKPMGGMGKM